MHYAAICQPQDAGEFIAALQGKLRTSLDRFEQVSAAGTTGGVAIVKKHGEPWIRVSSRAGEAGGAREPGGRCPARAPRRRRQPQPRRDTRAPGQARSPGEGDVARGAEGAPGNVGERQRRADWLGLLSDLL